MRSRKCNEIPQMTKGMASDLRHSSHDGRVHTTQKHRKPLPATLHHARRARDSPVGHNRINLALRPSPTRRSLYTKLRLRALRVCSCTSERPPRRIAATPNARRVGCVPRTASLIHKLLYIQCLVPVRRVSACVSVERHESAGLRRVRGIACGCLV